MARYARLLNFEVAILSPNSVPHLILVGEILMPEIGSIGANMGFIGKEVSVSKLPVASLPIERRHFASMNLVV